MTDSKPNDEFNRPLTIRDWVNLVAILVLGGLILTPMLVLSVFLIIDINEMWHGRPSFVDKR